MAKMTTMHTILSIATSQGWPLHQMDIKNAFLHGDLKEDIYMSPPLGLFSSSSSATCFASPLFKANMTPPCG
jgi:hypothetical protein